MLTPTTLATLRAHHVPGDLWPDVLAGDYHGPVSMRWHIDGEAPFDAEGTVVEHFTDRDGPRVLWWSPDERIGLDNRSPVFLRLPLHRPEARAHVARLMAGGLDGARRPAPAWHLLSPDESPTGLPAALAKHAAELLACHVARVAVGLEGVLCAAGAYATFRRPKFNYAGRGVERVSTCQRYKVLVYEPQDGQTPGGWYVTGPGLADIRGPETGPAGMAAADRAALTAGFALATDAGIVAPWPNIEGGEVRDA